MGRHITFWRVWTMTNILLFLFLPHLTVADPEPGSRQECSTASCGGSGLVIRFPFWLKDRQSEFCGYPGFELSCSNNNTVFELQLPVKLPTKNVMLQVSVKVSVQEIDYRSQMMKISALNTSCLPKDLPNMNSSVSPFEISEQDPSAYTLFNCSSNYTQKHPDLGNEISCLGNQGYRVLGFSSFYGMSELPLSSCIKMYDISNFPLEVFNVFHEYSLNETYLHWSTPFCAKCEAEGKYCKLKNNDTRQEIQCFDIPKHTQQQEHRKGILKSLVIICSAVGLLLVGAFFCIVSGVVSLKSKKEDLKKTELVLEDYKAFRLTNFSYADIKKITNQFKEKLGEESYGRVYKGKLANEITVVVKVLNNFTENGEEFIRVMRRIGRIHHVNLLRLLGYCADGKRRALVYEFIPNDSFLNMILSENQIHSLGYEKWQEIANGIAKGLDHIHRRCNQQILHLHINPNNILLNENYNPRITDIGLAELSLEDQNVISFIASQGMTDYVAPELLSSSFHNASEKSDVFSFGMLLFDIVGHCAGDGKSSQIYFPEWIYNHLNMEKDASTQIYSEGNSYMHMKLTIIGLWCTQWYPEDRPTMNVVIKMLEAENIPIMPPNPSLPRRSQQLNTTEEAYSTEKG